MTMNAGLPNSRLRQLDFLRGVAVLLVLMYHQVVAYPAAGFLGPINKINYGWTGVDLFFVLSGFLVGGLLFHEWRKDASLDVRRFLIRRGFKIWPAYAIYIGSMTILYLLDGSLGPPGRVVTLLAPNLLHLQSYVTTPLLHTWSLAVEEHFYLALPLILLLSSSNPKDRSVAVWSLLLAGFAIALSLAAIHAVLGSILPVERLPDDVQRLVRPYLNLGFLWLAGHQMILLLAAVLLVASYRPFQEKDLAAVPAIATCVMILCFAFRLTNELLSARFGLNLFYATHVRIDGLALGVLLGYWHHFEPDKLQSLARYPVILLLVGTALVIGVPAISSLPLLFSVGFVWIYLGYGCILLALLHAPPESSRLGRFLQNRPSRALASIGVYSYSIYLWHLGPARTWMDQRLYEGLGNWLPTEARWLVMTSLSLGAAILVGVFMAKLIEQPCLRLRDRVFPARADALALSVHTWSS